MVLPAYVCMSVNVACDSCINMCPSGSNARNGSGGVRHCSDAVNNGCTCCGDVMCCLSVVASTSSSCIITPCDNNMLRSDPMRVCDARNARMAVYGETSSHADVGDVMIDVGDVMRACGVTVGDVMRACVCAGAAVMERRPTGRKPEMRRARGCVGVGVEVRRGDTTMTVTLMYMHVSICRHKKHMYSTHTYTHIYLHLLYSHTHTHPHRHTYFYMHTYSMYMHVTPQSCTHRAHAHAHAQRTRTCFHTSKQAPTDTGTCTPHVCVTHEHTQ